MANQFGGNPDECISWSNGLTAVLIARIAVAAAELHENEWEYNFARWIASIDQNFFGIGCAGFDLCDIPWGPTGGDVAVQKQFLGRVIDYAATAQVEEVLPYYPNPERVAFHRGQLRHFGKFVRRSYVSRYPEPIATGWRWHFSPTNVLCVRHRVFCHEHGCMVCSDT